MLIEKILADCTEIPGDRAGRRRHHFGFAYKRERYQLRGTIGGILLRDCRLSLWLPKQEASRMGVTAVVSAFRIMLNPILITALCLIWERPGS